MTCDDARKLLSAFFDRELDVTRSLEVEEHLHTCGGCATALKEHQALRASLRGAALDFTPPPALARDIRKALRRETRPKASLALPWWRWVPVPAVAALAAMVTWGVAVRHGRMSTDDLLVSELVSGHVRSLMADHLVDVATSDQHTVKPWFNGKIDFAPPVADFTANGFPLVGGRVDYIGGRPVAVLIYRRRQHVVNVFIGPGTGAAATEPRRRESEGYHLLEWNQGGLAFAAVSDAGAADLESLAQLMRDQG